MRILGSDKQAAERRKQGLEMHRAGISNNEIARKMHVQPQTVRKWIREEAAGVSREYKRRGPAPLLTDKNIEKLKRELQRGAFAHGYAGDYWTLDRISQLIWQLFQKRYSASGTWRLMRRLGWSSQKPQRRSLQRDDEAVEAWTTQTWPKIKKRSGGAKQVGSS